MHDVGRAVLRHAEEEVERQLAAVVEHGDRAVRSSDATRAPGTNSMPRSANAASSAADVSGDGGTGRRERDHERDLAVVADAARGEVVVQQQRALARRGRALERRAADADDGAAARENAGSTSAQPLGAGDRVELVRRRRARAWRRSRSRRRARRRGSRPRSVPASVVTRSRSGVDRRDRLPHEAHAGLGDVAVRQPHRVERRPPEHHVELRVAEDEGVVLVDQRHVDVVAERLGEHGRELEPAEAGAEDDYPSRRH